MCDGGALAFDEVKRLVRVEGLGEDLPGTGRHRHQGGFRVAEGVEQRQVAHDGVVLGDRHAERAFLHVADQPMVVEHALGKAGGAGGVHHEHGVVGIHGVGTGSEVGVGDRLCRRECRRPGRRSRVFAVADDHDSIQFRE